MNLKNSTISNDGSVYLISEYKKILLDFIFNDFENNKYK
jgi:hypothetical protein